MLKGQKKHTDKEQGKTEHKAPRSVNYRATQNKNNIGTTALHYPGGGVWGGGKKAFHYETFGSHNGFLTQSMHLGENTKSNWSPWRNKERVLLANPALQARIKKKKKKKKKKNTLVEPRWARP